MRTSLTLLIIMAVGFFSCKQNDKSTPDTGSIDLDTVELTKEDIKQEPLTNHNANKYIDTRYEYSDSKKDLIIENSLPKGGLKYTDSNDKAFTYAIFWTRITNESNYPVEFTINFPTDSFKISSSPDNYFKLLVPQDTMTIEKQSLFNYGLTHLVHILDEGLDNPSSLKRTVKPKGIYSFYVITLFTTGVEGAVRAGLKLKENGLFYRVNNEEFQCGQIKIQGLK